MRRASALTLTGLATLALAGCGTSAADKARSQVCDARSDIAKQVDTLSGLTVSAATTDQISSSLKAIGDDLKKIANAQGDLSDQRKQEVQQANKAFTDQMSQIASDLGKSLSLSDASQQLTSSLKQLATAYKQTFQRIDCEGA